MKQPSLYNAFYYEDPRRIIFRDRTDPEKILETCRPILHPKSTYYKEGVDPYRFAIFKDENDELVIVQRMATDVMSDF